MQTCGWKKHRTYWVGEIVEKSKGLLLDFWVFALRTFRVSKKLVLRKKSESRNGGRMEASKSTKNQNEYYQVKDLFLTEQQEGLR